MLDQLDSTLLIEVRQHVELGSDSTCQTTFGEYCLREDEKVV